MEIERLVRFQRPRAVLELHDIPPGTDVVDARAFGVPVNRLRAIRRRLSYELVELAAELGDAAARFEPRDRIVALGDSITSDALSWFEQLAIAARMSGARFVNAAISGDTTADLRKRVFRITALRPRQVLVLVGTNDCQRHGPRGDLLVGAGETLRNLLALDAGLRSAGAQVTWITPPPIDEAGLSGELAARGLSFRNADLDAVAVAMRSVSEHVIDLRDGFRGDGLWDDGLHPSPRGQLLIARRVLAGLR